MEENDSSSSRPVPTMQNERQDKPTLIKQRKRRKKNQSATTTIREMTWAAVCTMYSFLWSFFSPRLHAPPPALICFCVSRVHRTVCAEGRSLRKEGCRQRRGEETTAL